ncbi:MAG: MOSC domain-containing protein [Sandaracinaceae bacterium]
MRASELLRHIPQVGSLTWIGIRPARGEPMEALTRAELLTDRGIRGDRASKRAGGKRQVSLYQVEHLDVLARLLHRGAIDPSLTRRNLFVQGVNLRALMKTRFFVGDCLLHGTGEAHPCSKMETALGPGGYAAMRGHGGILAKVVEGGTVELGASVRIAPLE